MCEVVRFRRCSWQVFVYNIVGIVFEASGCTESVGSDFGAAHQRAVVLPRVAIRDPLSRTAL